MPATVTSVRTLPALDALSVVALALSSQYDDSYRPPIIEGQTLEVRWTAYPATHRESIVIAGVDVTVLSTGAAFGPTTDA